MALRRLEWRAPLPTLAPFAHEPFALGLLSDGSAQGRWSYLCWRPKSVFSTLDGLRAGLLEQTGAAVPHPDHPPFQGGSAGLATYEWGAAIDPAMPARDSRWPLLSGGVYDRLLAFDHREHCVWAVARTPEGMDDAIHRWSAGTPVRTSGPVVLRERGASEDYRLAVDAVREAIQRGDLFQANIARSWTGRLPASAHPFEVFARLVLTSPAPFAGYLNLGRQVVVSNSPERFLKVAASGHVETRPIKGTRPRGATVVEDQALAEALLASEKDRAENLMIVDLMRNDLARACAPGSVKVEALCALESFTNVHHLVSTVVGRLGPDTDPAGLFASAFPPGSVTGAPKIQAMIEIHRHESSRGPYCGSLFWAGGDGGLDSSVLIRTLGFERDLKGWRFETRAGGGITSGSVSEEEDDEAQAKIAAIRSALGAFPADRGATV